jgi:hypothetical protein
MPKITRLAEVHQHMKDLYSKQLAEEVTIRDSAPIDKSLLNPKECQMQLTFVNPDYELDQKYGYNGPRQDYAEKNTNIRIFKFSVPFVAPGKNMNEIKHRQQRNTTLIVPYAFPSVTTSQKVMERIEEILSPMETAAADIFARVEKFQEVLGQEPVSYKKLTQLIGGSLLPLVNGGVNQICEAFLIEGAPGAEPESEDDKKHKAFLKKSLRDFLDCCKRALGVNELLSAGDEKALLFHEEVASKFDKLCEYLFPLINETKKKPGGQKKVVSFSDGDDSQPRALPPPPPPSGVRVVS